MKIKDLVSKLSTLDQSLEVYGYYESTDANAADETRIFNIETIDEAKVVMSRDPNTQQAQIAFRSKAVGATKLVLISITPDF